MSSYPTPYPVRLVATDLDGTLLDPFGEVRPRMTAAVRAAREAGIAVIPVTARPPSMLWDIAEQAGLGPFGVCCNGAVLVDLATRQVLESTALAQEVSARLVAELRQLFPEARFALDNLGGFIHERDFFAWDVPVEWQAMMTPVDDILDAIDCACIKIIARVPELSAAELLDRLEGALAQEAHLTTSGLDWIDIGAPGVTKAYAVERLCDRLGVSVSEVIAVGDNHNDLPVLAWAATAAAPANAIPEVLAAVDHVLPSNGDDGVAVLLESLVSSQN
jgi:Cof subfamily protein (haloacid dehalogenase superfamily)